MLGASNARELAAALGMTKLDDERRVRAWVNGESAPNFYGTMLLLERAGMLSESPTPPATPGAGDPLVALDRRLDVDVIPRLDAIANELRSLSIERGRVG